MLGLLFTWKGHRFGNQIADAININRGVFHNAIELGGNQKHLIFLSECAKNNVSIEETLSGLLPYLSLGLVELNKRWGSQEEINNATTIIFEMMPPNKAYQILEEAKNHSIFNEIHE